MEKKDPRNGAGKPQRNLRTEADLLTRPEGSVGPADPRRVPDGTERATPRTLPETFSDERDDVLTVINELEDQLDRYEEIREALERELNEANGALQTTRQRVQELEWQVATLQTRVGANEQARQEITLLEQEIAEVNTRNQRLTDQVGALEQDNSRLTGELKAANKQLEEFWLVRRERDGLRADLKSAKARLEQEERQKQEIDEERKLLAAKLDESQNALEETRAAKHQVEMNLRTTCDEREELRRTVDALSEKIETVRTEKRNADAQVTRLERDNARLAEQQKFYECEMTSLRSMNRNAESALSNVKRAFAEVRIALSETKSRARRRTIENWPRIQTALNELADTPPNTAEETSETLRLQPTSTEAD